MIRSFKGGHSRQSSATSTWSWPSSPSAKGGHSRQPSATSTDAGGSSSAFTGLDFEFEDTISLGESASSDGPKNGSPATGPHLLGWASSNPVGTSVIARQQNIHDTQRFLSSVSSHQQVQHGIPHPQQQFMQQVHVPGMPAPTVIMQQVQQVGYPPHAMPMQTAQWQGGQGGQNPNGVVIMPSAESMPSVSESPDAGNVTERSECMTETGEETPTSQVDNVQGWSPQYMPTGIVHGTSLGSNHEHVVHGAVPYALAPQMPFMHQHHVLQPIPAQYTYPTVQAAPRYFVAPQQLQWHPLQSQQVQPQPAAQPEKEVLIPPFNPQGVNDSLTNELHSSYAMYAFRAPFEGDGIVYEAPCSHYTQTAEDQSEK